MNPSIFFLSSKQSDLFIKATIKRKQYVEGIKRHLDSDSIKSATGLTTLVGLSDVWVDEEPDRTAPHHLISYNESYQRIWGDAPLYGNVLIILSQKAWDALPAEKRLTDARVAELNLKV